MSYFSSLPGVAPLPDHVNPATWMLDVLHTASAPSAAAQPQPPPIADSSSASAEEELPVASGGLGLDFPALYGASALAKENLAVVQRTSVAVSPAEAGVAQAGVADATDARAVSYWRQLRVVMARSWSVLIREAEYGGNRCVSQAAWGRRGSAPQCTQNASWLIEWMGPKGILSCQRSACHM